MSAIPGISGMPGAGSTRGVADAASGATDDTLYVASSTAVYAYPIGASGVATGGTSFQVNTSGIVGIETATSGAVDVLQDYQNTAGAAPIGDCSIIEVPPGASGTTPPQNFDFDCQAVSSTNVQRGRAITRGTSGSIDSLVTNGGTDDIVRTNFANAAPYLTTSFALPGTGHHGLAEGAGGHLYVSSASANAPIVTGGNASTTGCSATATGNATVINIAPNTSTPKFTFTISGRTAAGMMALAPNQTSLYVADCDASGSLYLDEINTQGASGAISPVATIGPFGNQSITALIVDSAGDVFVGLTVNDGSGATNVRVYAASSFNSTTPSKPVPLRILNNPVPVVSGAKITSLALGNVAGSATATPTATATATATAAPSDTPVATPTPTAMPTATPTAAPTPTATATPVVTPTPTTVPTASPTPTAAPDPCITQTQVNADASPLISTTTTTPFLSKVAGASNVCFSAYVFTTVAYNALDAAAKNHAHVHVIFSSQEASQDNTQISQLRTDGANVTIVSSGSNSTYPIHAKMAIVDGSAFLDGHNWVEHSGNVPDDVVIADNSSADFASIKAALNISNPSSVPDSTRTVTLTGTTTNAPAFTVLKDHSLTNEAQFLQTAINNGQVGPGTTVDYMTESFSSGAASVVSALEAAGQAGAAVNVIVVYSDESSSDLSLLHTMTQPPYNIKVYSNTSTGSEKVMSIQGSPGVPGMVWFGSSNSTSTTPNSNDFIDWGMLITDSSTISTINAYYAQQLSVATQKTP